MLGINKLGGKKVPTDVSNVNRLPSEITVVPVKKYKFILLNSVDNSDTYLVLKPHNIKHVRESWISIAHYSSVK